jgi:hypothetical protein
MTGSSPWRLNPLSRRIRRVCIAFPIVRRDGRAVLDVASVTGREQGVSMGGR